MTEPPAQPKLYHITHLENLPSIVADGMLVSDAAMIARDGPARSIGMSEIKRRRVEELEVSCCPGTMVGDYVPFYFCPRSVMLYVISRANNPSLSYHGGQEPIVHLEADLHSVVEWAEREHRGWAFSLANAGARYTPFRNRVDELNQLDWNAITARDFKDSDVKESKQAEFLLHEYCPFDLIERIGVRGMAAYGRVNTALVPAAHGPSVAIMPEWYF
ncbi:MAG: type II toxin-antitoxin system toxin DNA ADP-ribosyl transferase DarT [Terriglobales bacterium]